MVFEEPDQEAAVAPEQGHVVVSGIGGVETAAEVAFGVLEGDGLSDEGIELREGPRTRRLRKRVRRSSGRRDRR